MRRALTCLSLVMLPASVAFAQARGCSAPLASPSVTIMLPGSPFGVVPSRDGCWVFASIGGPTTGIAVLKRQDGHIDLVRVVPVQPAPAGIALTHDGQLLAAAATNSAVVLDVNAMTAGTGNPIVGTFSGAGAKFFGSVYANVSPDDKLLFISEESAEAVTVIDLERARKNGYKRDAIIGDIPVGRGPIALTFSPDGKWLYTTSELAAAEWMWPPACKPEGSNRTDLVNPEGAIVVVDVARARTDPANAAVARISAGCSAVRMAISPDGRRVYVTARNSNRVVAFDTAKLLVDAEHARVGTAGTGEAPVPVAVIDGGKKVVVGNSNRFGGANAPQTLSVFDAAKIEQEGSEAGLGTIPAGAFPRELSVSSDGHTLYLTNAASSSIQVIDIDHLPIEPPGHPTAPPIVTQAPKARPGDTAAAAGGTPAAVHSAATDLAAAAADKASASEASGYASQAAAAPGGVGASRSAESAAAAVADTAAAAAETAAAAVESDVSKAAAALAAGDTTAANAAQAQAMTDYSALLEADAQLVDAATKLAKAASANADFYGGATTGAGAINDMGAQDASAVANLLSAVSKGGTAGYTAAAANEAAAMKDANTIAAVAGDRATAFQAAAAAQAAAQAANTAAAAGGSASAAAAALAAAAIAGATADGPGNPFARAVEVAAAAVANAASATVAAQQAVKR